MKIKEFISLNRELQYVIHHDRACNALYHQYQLGDISFEETLTQMIVLLHQKKERLEMIIAKEAS